MQYPLVTNMPFYCLHRLYHSRLCGPISAALEWLLRAQDWGCPEQSCRWSFASENIWSCRGGAALHSVFECSWHRCRSYCGQTACAPSLKSSGGRVDQLTRVFRLSRRSLFFGTCVMPWVQAGFVGLICGSAHDGTLRDLLCCQDVARRRAGNIVSLPCRNCAVPCFAVTSSLSWIAPYCCSVPSVLR